MCTLFQGLQLLDTVLPAELTSQCVNAPGQCLAHMTDSDPLNFPMLPSFCATVSSGGREADVERRK